MRGSMMASQGGDSWCFAAVVPVPPFFICRGGSMEETAFILMHHSDESFQG